MRPFEGVRVLDLTHVYAGPFSAFQLGVLGADVIKIEPVGRPDMVREDGLVDALNAEGYGTNFLAQNGGKRGIALDLRMEPGKEALRRLIKTADVLIQNYAGDALADLGFGYDAVAAIKSDIIYCTMTGFGRTGPKANDPAYDIVIQAYSGLMSFNGTPESGPTRVGPAMVDYGTGAQAALAISAALYQRTVTGKGQQIDVAMADAAMMLMSVNIVDTMLTGKGPNPVGNVHPDLAGYRTYDTADGLLMVGAYTNKQFVDLMNALGETARAAELARMTRPQIRAARDQDTVTLTAIFTTRTAAEWEDLLNAAHVPAARVRTVDEALAHPQRQSRAVVQTAQAKGAQPGPDTFPVAAFTYAHGSPQLDRPPPRHGEHTAEVLAELGYTQAEITGMRAAGSIT